MSHQNQDIAADLSDSGSINFWLFQQVSSSSGIKMYEWRPSVMTKSANSCVKQENQENPGNSL